MELHEYPRPANDTGIGIHWSVGYASAIGLARIREFWLPELKAMGVKWVKIYNHEGAQEFAELLLAEGFMPVMRIYRASPNPGRLGVKEMVQIDAFLRLGVRYFEFNSEPDQDAEWKGGRVPANGIDLVVENTVANLELILERGGMPGIPAVSNGNRWDLVGKIIAYGRKDLFAGPVWQAIHNYSRNRPLDYPYDIGNQEGAAYTHRFYQVVADENWGDNAWRGRTLDEVNRLRADRANPGATINEDSASWLAYEFFDARLRSHLGRSLPILSTENGYLVGEDTDARYPATTPDLHMAQTLEACRIMMGTSQRFKPAPDYYFCTAFWLLGNEKLGSTSTWWENHAWYSDRWPGGSLPVVWSLKAEPKTARHWQSGGTAGELIKLVGTVAHAGENRLVVVEKGGRERARALLDANSRFTIPELLPGNYLVRMPGTQAEQAVELTPDQPEVVLNFDLSPPPPTSARSQISGKVRGGSGAVVMLLRASDGEEWVTMARNDGSFRFIDLPPATYNLRVNPEGSHVENIVLDGVAEREVELAVAGWGYTTRVGAEAPNVGAIFCRVEGHNGLAVRVHTAAWSSEPVYTGSAPDIGPFACQIEGLEIGHYILSVDGLTDEDGKRMQIEARVHVDKKRIPLVEFVHSKVDEPAVAQNSSIVGRVIGGVALDQKNLITLIDSQANRLEQPLDAEGRFAFEELAAGLYSVELQGYDERIGQADIALDGANHVALELFVPMREPEAAPNVALTRSAIVGKAPGAAGTIARLVDRVGNELKQVVDDHDCVRFDGLAAGVYALFVEPGYQQTNLTVDGSNGQEVTFSELLPRWEAETSSAGSMPGYSVVRVEVEKSPSLPVHIWKEDWEGMMRRTGSKPEYGQFALEFSPLGPGQYMVEPEGLGIWTGVELTGLEAVWINFRRYMAPSAPNVVRPLALVAEPTPVVTGQTTPEQSAYYLYIGPNQNVNANDLIAILRFASHFRPAIGNSLEAAMKADHVIILGRPDEVSTDVELLLRSAMIEVERVPGGIAEFFKSRLA